MYETRSAGLIKIPAQAQASRAARTRARGGGEGEVTYFFKICFICSY